MVTIPISMTRPIIVGTSSSLRATSNARNAPPVESDIAERIVTGCRKSLNSSTSTQKMQSMPTKPRSEFARDLRVAPLDQ